MRGMVRRLVAMLTIGFTLGVGLGVAQLQPARAASPSCVGCVNGGAAQPPKVKVGPPFRISRGGVVYSCQLWYLTLMGEWELICSPIAYPWNNWRLPDYVLWLGSFQ